MEWLRYICLLPFYLLFRWAFRHGKEIWSAGFWKASDTIVYFVVPATILLCMSYLVLNENVT